MATILKCPNCGVDATPQRKHCRSRICSWYICYCEETDRIICIVFDIKDRCFLVPRVHKED